MPSPFTHLHIAEKIHAELSDRNLAETKLEKILDDGWPSFYFGSVAPDYQTLSGHPREMTHFYKLPPDLEDQAYPEMFAQYRELAQGHHLRLEHAAFIAAYSAHLLLDLIWFREVLVPFFYLGPQLGDFKERHLLHLILLTYIDKLAFDQLPETAGITLSRAKPDDWLPFAADADLHHWQKFLVAQLQPGAISETIKIYANRLQMTPEEFAAKLDDRVWMQEHLLAKIPVAKVLESVYSAVPKSIDLIIDYLNGGFV